MLIDKVARKCSIENCEKPVHGKGMCGTHYMRWQTHGDPLFVKKIHGDDEARFWSFVDKTPGLGPQGDCWDWIGLKTKDGYGSLGIGGKMILAHRYSYFLRHGIWPEPECLHSCHRPSCVRWAHLRAGTQQENVQDMVDAGRRAAIRGSDHKVAKLTNEDVLWIRDNYPLMTKAELARAKGVSHRLIRNILNRTAWSHI